MRLLTILCRMLDVFVMIALYVGLGPLACLLGWANWQACWVWPIYIKGWANLYVGLAYWYVGLGLLWRVRPNLWVAIVNMYGMWYFGEFTKLCAYNLWFKYFSSTSSSKGKGLKWSHWIPRVYSALASYDFYSDVLRELILLLSLGKNEWMFWLVKNEIFTLYFGTLKVGIRALVWGIWAHCQVCLNSN